MKEALMSVFTRSPLHVGAGNSVGAVDAPVMRERHTGIPVIPGSSLKGVLADLWPMENRTDADGKTVRYRGPVAAKLFGSSKDKEGEDKAGQLLIGEARVLAFPVRSAKNAFAWVTCPLALNRLKVEGNLAFEVPEVKKMACLAPERMCFTSGGAKAIVLEEYRFEQRNTLPDDLVKALSKLAPENALWQTLKERLVVVADEMFCYFCKQACEVVTRIRINDETGVVEKGALFNQELVPSEAMFLLTLRDTGRNQDFAAVEVLKGKLEEDNILQIGGDETVGYGFCAVNIMEVK